jgi:hypothetical protein
MRLWIPVAFAIVILFAYAFFYSLEALEQQGASSFSVVNTVGLIAVVIGIVAAFAVLRRTRPP